MINRIEKLIKNEIEDLRQGAFFAASEIYNFYKSKGVDLEIESQDFRTFTSEVFDAVRPMDIKYQPILDKISTIKSAWSDIHKLKAMSVVLNFEYDERDVRFALSHIRIPRKDMGY